MNLPINTNSVGQVESLHLHPQSPGDPLHSVESILLVKGKGILNEPRYFGRVSQDTGKPTKRQATLIEREQLAEHAAALGLRAIPPGAVRSNIETSGINLVALVGREIQIGSAVLLLYAPRDPCAKMDAVCQGLRQRMMDERQGVLAQIIQSGLVRIGDRISVRSLASTEPAPRVPV